MALGVTRIGTVVYYLMHITYSCTGGNCSGYENIKICTINVKKHFFKDITKQDYVIVTGNYVCYGFLVRNMFVSHNLLKT